MKPTKQTTQQRVGKARLPGLGRELFLEPRLPYPFPSRHPASLAAQLLHGEDPGSFYLFSSVLSPRVVIGLWPVSLLLPSPTTTCGTRTPAHRRANVPQRERERVRVHVHV